MENRRGARGRSRGPLRQQDDRSEDVVEPGGRREEVGQRSSPQPSTSHISVPVTRESSPLPSTSRLPAIIDDDWESPEDRQKLMEKIAHMYSDDEEDMPMQGMISAIVETERRYHLTSSSKKGTGTDVWSVGNEGGVMPSYNSKSNNKEKEQSMIDIGQFILGKINSGKGFCLLTGPPGCGKSSVGMLAYTKRMIRELQAENLKIYIAEPRRVAAKSLYEQLISVGGVVNLKSHLFGMKMRAVFKDTRDTILIVGTAGWLSVFLLHNPDRVYEYHTIVIDEVHEFSLDTEFLMAEMKCLHHKHLERSDSRRFPDLILISATMNSHDLKIHFRPDSYGPWKGSSVPSTAQLTAHMSSGINKNYVVKQMSLDELPSEMGISTDYAKGQINDKKEPPKLYDSVIQIVFESINTLLSNYKFVKYRNGVFLVHVPGVPEITRFQQFYAADLEAPNRLCRHLLQLIPFHGLLSLEDQMSAKAMLSDRSTNVTKVLLATPIADSSLTFDSCTVVFDSCLIKHMNLNVDTGMETLDLFWADIAVQTQRKGRTGRQNDGIYIKLIPGSFMIDDTPNEICRIRLEDTFVKVLKMGEGAIARNVQGFVSKFFKNFFYSKAPKLHLELAITNLLNAGLLVLKANYKHDVNYPYDGFKLTVMGTTASKFQMSSAMLRALILGNMIGSFDMLCAVAAEDSNCRNFFFRPGDRHLLIGKFRKSWALNISSDQLVIGAIFRVWMKSNQAERTDGQPKKCQQQYKMSRISSYRDEEFVINEDLFGCNISSLTAVDDGVHDILTDFKDNGLGVNSNIGHLYAGTEKSDRDLANLADKIMQLISLVISTPSKYHFNSEPTENFPLKSTNLTCVLNSVYFYATPPEDSDVREWGPQLMSRMSGPSKIPCDIIVDRANNLIICTYAPATTDAWLGKIHQSVKEILHWSEYDGNEQHQIYYTPTTKDNPISKDAVLTSYSEEQRKKDKLIRNPDITPDQPTKFTSKTFFQVMDFKNPYNFGVQRFQIKEETGIAFLAMSNHLFDVRTRYKNVGHMNLDQVQFGVKVIFDNPKKSNLINAWEQRFQRGLIYASVDAHVLQTLNDYQKSKYEVYVDLIDHGTVVKVRTDRLYFYEEGVCDYGIPDLFTRLPRLGYRVSLSSLQPNYLLCENWYGTAIEKMSKFLGDPPFGAVVTLDIIWSNEFRNRIIATNIRPQKKVPYTSFVDFCITGGYALEMQNVWIEDMTMRMDSPNFCPRPANKLDITLYNKKCTELQRLGDANSSLVKSFPLFYLFSPMEVNFKRVRYCYPDLSLKIGRDSLNCRALDSRLADTTMSVQKYDPLIGVGLNMKLIGKGNDRQFYSTMTTVLPPLPSILAISQMLIYPAVEVIILKKPGPVAVKLMDKDSDGDIVVACILDLKTKLSKADLSDIDYLRNCINDRHMIDDPDTDHTSFRRILTSLLQRYRSPCEFEIPEFLTTVPRGAIIKDQFMRPDVIRTVLD